METDMRFGEFIKEKRKGRGLTLRRFCMEHGFDPGNMSRLERGLARPPQGDEKLEQYARALGIERETDDWYTLRDLAYAEVGRVPSEILEDAEVVAALPVLFRTLRGQPVDDDRLNDLVDLVREHAGGKRDTGEVDR